MSNISKILVDISLRTTFLILSSCELVLGGFVIKMLLESPFRVCNDMRFLPRGPLGFKIHETSMRLTYGPLRYNASGNVSVVRHAGKMSDFRQMSDLRQLSVQML